MDINEIKAGEIFCIEGTKSYPKLKLDVGYVDMRDEIVKRDPGKDLEYQLMTAEEVKTEFSKYGMIMSDVTELKQDLMDRYNKKRKEVR